MARTAPVPNIPAIPGMNPGVFVMGGGGGGGGDDGKGGDGNGCGANPGCGHPSHGSPGAAVGDPIDVGSGVVFMPPIVDVHIEGAFPLVFQRFYRSSRTEHDVGLGPGWSHSLAWRLTTRRRTLTVHRPDGTAVEVSALAEGQATIGDGLCVVAMAFGHVISAGGLRIVMKPGIVAEAQVPTLITDSFGNGIVLEYEAGRLARAIDDAGREVRFRWDASGRMTAIQVKTAPVQGRWQTLVSYDHDEAGALVATRDAIGAVTRYEYDEAFRLLRRITANGFRFVYRYDRSGRAVETWCEADDPEALGLGARVSPTLADNSTKGLGIYHVALTYGDDMVEVASGRAVDRYDVSAGGIIPKIVNGGAVHTRAMDADGRLLGYTDPEGAETRVIRDAMGNVLEVTNPLGAVTYFTRSDDGALLSMTDALGGETTIDYGPNRIRWSDPIGAVFEVTTDTRGLITSTIAPNGARSDHRYDADGNEVESVGRYGQVTRRTFDHMGRCTSITDGEGGTCHYLYNDRGDLVRKVDALGGATHYQVDAEGNVIEAIDPDGRVTRLRYGPLGKMLDVVRGDGCRVSLRYDRDGLLVEIRNGLDETYRIERDVCGLPVAETTFDGRTIRSGYDRAGRLAWTMSTPEDRVEYAYDACGRLVAAVFADDHQDLYEYDALGRLLRAENAEVSVTFERNAVGWATTERQAHAGETHTITREYDAMGKVVRESTSAGFSAAYERDEYGLPQAITLDGSARVELHRDLLGRETQCYLPGGGRIETEYDHAGHVTRRTSYRAIPRGTRAGEPAWVGGPRGATSQRAFGYSSASELVDIFDSDRGRERLEYDAMGQLLAVVPESARARLFAYDDAGNRYERAEGSARRLQHYETGGRLIESAGVRYSYDEAGRLVERTSPEGTTIYKWSARGTLDTVTLPDGRTNRYAYDAFRRRVSAVSVAPRQGGGDTMRRTRFVWNAEALIHDIEVRPGRDGQPDVREERTYCNDDDDQAPWAQRLHAGGEARWSFSVRDPRGDAVREIDGAGEVVARPEVGAWGDRSTEPRAISRFGLPGQYADDTGLAYNRFRYYDPATGRYLSPDPVGLAGGTALYGYAHNNPVRFVDAVGLMPTSVIYDSQGRVIARGTSARGVGASTTVQHGNVTGQAITQASDFVDHQGNRQRDPSRSAGPCAEAAALSDLERSIRRDHPNMTNDQVRAEMQRRVQGGRMETHDDDGHLMAPCPTCARMLDNLGLPPSLVVAPAGAADASGRWNGRSTQSAQGDPLVDRPDDQAETRNMHRQPGYRSPAERAADERQARADRNRAVYNRRRQHESDGWDRAHAEELANDEYNAGELDRDGRPRPRG